MPNVVIMYVIVGIGSVVIFQSLAIVFVIIVLRKKLRCESLTNRTDVGKHPSNLQKKVSLKKLVNNAWDQNFLENQFNLYSSLQRQDNLKNNNNFSI